MFFAPHDFPVLAFPRSFFSASGSRKQGSRISPPRRRLRKRRA